MNIKEAKTEIINTVRAYLMKDDTGAYRIPIEKQRPLLLIGPPGIGKTAIMEQAARELGINLVAYTITHHTRQSAIGLPYISKKSFGGKEYSVTEYTMSEIIAAMYEQIEKSGIQEGILFLDEINCVSETLAPTMLQFLQYKTFGSHRIPEGFVIVAAGNPPEYNKSVRDFDIVTLDRVRRMDITEDYPVWKEYAYRAGVHGAILAYLDIKKENFYSVRQELGGKSFVTARGWEDLSRIVKLYEEMQLPVTKALVLEYLEEPEIARDFAAYYELYQKYRQVYRIPEILDGHFPEDTVSLLQAPFDEKLSLLGLLVDALNQEFRAYAEALSVQRKLFGELKALKEALDGAAADTGRTAAELLAEQRQQSLEKLEQQHDAQLISREEERYTRKMLSLLEALAETLKKQGSRGAEADYDLVRNWFRERETQRKQAITDTGAHLSHALQFISQSFGEGQELVIFLSELSAGYYSLKFVTECGNEDYYHFNRFLLLRDKRSALQQQAAEMLAL